MLGLVAILVLVVGFYEGRKAYWDYQVRQMCEKDGGVFVYERVFFKDEEYRRLGGNEHGLPVPFEKYATPDSAYVRLEINTRIREWNPQVVRTETFIKRRSDGKVLGRSVQYWRSGGDIPTGLSEPSNFICPQHTRLAQAIFRLEEASK